MNKTILITGGAGFIGSNFVKYIREHKLPYDIIVVDSLTYAGNLHNLPSELLEGDEQRFWYGDVKNGQLIDLLVSRSNLVVHFAAESHVTRSIYDNRTFVETDVIGTQTVASAVAKYRDTVEKFIHISTSEVYGTANTEVMDEEHALKPLSPYASAKCGADRLVYSYWATYDIPAVIVRPFNNYGPNQHLEKLVPRFVTSCLLGEPLTVHGDGSAARDFMHVTDLCRAVLAIINAPNSQVVGEVFNFGTGKHTSIYEMAEHIRKLMNCPNIPIKRIGDRPGQVFRHTCDYRKAKKVLGWDPLIQLDDGLAQVAQWYRENRNWWQPQLWMRRVPIITAGGVREFH